MLTRLPQPDRLTLAARYRPAGARDQVGGDWYDAVALSDADPPHGRRRRRPRHPGRGGDGPAAQHAADFAWTHPEDTPARLVERLDRASDELGLGAMATLVHARMGRRTASAPVRAPCPGRTPDTRRRCSRTTTARRRTRATTACSADPLLGAAPERDRTDHTRVLPPGATLLLYTDGLIERRGEHLDAGIDRARDAVARHRGEPLDGFLDGVLCDLVGDDPDDDVVVLAVRVPA